jgi:prepilin-type N-terminal cleavage/methylation domain-containing protein
MHIRKNHAGFTLIEIMIAVTISVIITSAIYQIFHSQQRSYLIQDRAAEMQQNLRAGLYMMAREIRSAGYDPELTGNFGVVTDFAPPDDIFATDINYVTDKNIIAFTMDSDTGPGVVNKIREEQVVYRLASNQLQRYNVETAAWEIVADNIDALDFVLVDQNGTVTTNPADVAAVEITLLVRTDEQDKKYSNAQIYRNKRGQDVCPSCSTDPNLKRYRRRVLSTTVGVRNS